MQFEIVKKVIVETLGCEEDKVTPEAKLIEDLGADSLAMVEMIMSLEEETGLTIDDEVSSQMKTIGDIVKHLEANA